MEVRGRDSAGLHVFVWDHGLSLGDPAVRSLLDQRTHDPLFQNGLGPRGRRVDQLRVQGRGGDR
jgi:anti-sigma regulatory factor (Ser/Thr protein kinase)